jgi:RimJ/RimL family protein N-acetyltransferase
MMTPITTSSPPNEIETERLLIRLPLPEDAIEVNNAIQETFDQLHVWMEWAEQCPTVDETRAHVTRAHEDFTAGKDFGYFGFLKGTPAFVLAVGLHPRDPAARKFEIGYWCRLKYQRQGYVTEAVRALTLVGFDVANAGKIEIRCDPENRQSKRVAERAGYLLETTVRNDKLRPDGSIRDTLIYSLLSEQFEGRLGM